MVWLFWSSLAFLVYAFFGYAIFLVTFSWFLGRRHRRAAILPSVSVIIVANNEAARISQKIRNTLALEYPAERREIVVVSDGSEDATAEMVRRFAPQGVKLVEILERRGKHHGQMVARDAAVGEILIFTDVAIRLQPQALRQMVSNFADPSVGCVSSEDRILGEDQAGQAESAYVRFDAWMRRRESQIGSLVSVSGSFFAARREVCELWHSHQSSDFFVPLHTAVKGMRTVLDPDCVGYYTPTASGKSEYPRKVRTIVHGLDVFFTHLELLNPFRYGLFSWQLLSHKLIRWLVPYAAVCLLGSNLALWNAGILYKVSVIAQLALYGFGLVGLTFRSSARIPPVRVLAFVMMTNAATLKAWFHYLAGERFVTWNPTLRHEA